MIKRRILLTLCLVGLWLAPAFQLLAADAPASAAEELRSGLVQAQLRLTRTEQSAVLAEIQRLQARYTTALAQPITAVAPDEAQALTASFAALSAAVEQQDAPSFAAARAQLWTTLLRGSLIVVDHALGQGEVATAQRWLAVREFRTATRFSRAATGATLALDQVAAGLITPADAQLAVRADLLDTYQARLQEVLRDLAGADKLEFAARRAELATLAQGYFTLLAPTYAEQRGAAAAQAAQQAFTDLQQRALGQGDLSVARQAVASALQDFRAAPLSPAEQARRAGQLVRYLGLVPVEYARGVANGQVIKTLEIQEAVTFLSGAQAAFADLQELLAAHNRSASAAAADLLSQLQTRLDAASTGGVVADPDDIAQLTDQVTTVLTTAMPESWQKASTAGDFAIITALLDQVENAVRAQEYALAESARLEAYAMMESGPEARLMIFAPELKLRLEELFWNGQGETPGLAYLLQRQAPLAQVQATRATLDQELASAQALVAQSSAPGAVLGNATIIVFREGLEAVLILASLMGSMKLGESRKYRRPLWWGAALAFGATALTWLLARTILLSLARYGEKLEAVVSLIAIAVLLLITNWFFHKMYWNDWIASFHSRKRQLLNGEAGLLAGLVLLGFTSVYREGFETVLFLQALVLEAGNAIVLAGVALGLAATLLVGVITFSVQARLPYKKMLIVTGVMIGGVLLMMVGNSVHVLQVVGWLPIHLIGQLTAPIWLSTWFGLYPTWEGLSLQLAAALFVIGSYYLAEHQLHEKRNRPEVERKVEEMRAAQAMH